MRRTDSDFVVGGAVDALPPVEEVVPGLWSLPVPLWKSPLRYVLVYAFETDESGLVLVDAGWDGPGAFQALQQGLGVMGAGIRDVEGLIVTHLHPDHYGLAGRIVENSGAWLGMHPADAARIEQQYENPESLLEQTAAWLQRAGTPASERAGLRDASLFITDLVGICHPDVTLEDRDRPPIAGWDVTMVHTPGHTPGHLCAYEAGTNVLLTGDHVLPRISPNVSTHELRGHNPLSDYLKSLEALREFAGAYVLPAHEWRFEELIDRIDSLLTHHEQRLDEIELVVTEGAGTVWEIASQLAWSRDWDEPAFLRRAALGETYAHLLLIEARGRLSRTRAVPEVWSS